MGHTHTHTHPNCFLANRFPQVTFVESSWAFFANYILPALLACRTRKALSLILRFLMLEQATPSWLGELARWINPHPQVEWEILLPVWALSYLVPYRILQICSIFLGHDWFLPDRMCFPSITPTTTPLQVLPQFVEVLGKKMDKARAEVDWIGFCQKYLTRFIASCTLNWWLFSGIVPYLAGKTSTCWVSAR